MCVGTSRLLASLALCLGTGGKIDHKELTIVFFLDSKFPSVLSFSFHLSKSSCVYFTYNVQSFSCAFFYFFFLLFKYSFLPFPCCIYQERQGKECLLLSSGSCVHIFFS